MRTILIVLAALSLAPLASAQSAHADGSVASSATLTFYDAGGNVISAAEGEADLSHAATVDLVTADGARSSFEITAAAATAEEMTVDAGGSNAPLLNVVADILMRADADADAGTDGNGALEASASLDASGKADASSNGGAVLEVDVDEETGLTTNTVTTPSGVMISLRSIADGSVEVTVYRTESPVHDDAATEAGADVTVEADAGVGTEAGGDAAADGAADADAGADADADAEGNGSAEGKVDAKVGGSVDLDGGGDD